MKIVEKLKKVFNNYSENRLKKLEENDRKKRGVVLNKFGQEILEKEITVRGYNLHSNLLEWGWQPRAIEMRRAVEPILRKADGDLFSLDEETGDVYIASDLKIKGKDAKPLIQIDMEVEKKLFDFVAREVLTGKMFRGCSPANPVIAKMVSSAGGKKVYKVYPKNNPSEIRGEFTLSDTVHVSKNKPVNDKKTGGSVKPSLLGGMGGPGSII